MKLFLAAALTASVLSFGFAATSAYAQNTAAGTSSSKDRIHQKMATKKAKMAKHMKKHMMKKHMMK